MSRTSTGRACAVRAAFVPCHNAIGAGTGVLTGDGELPVEYLVAGDRIVTFDRGLVRLARTEYCDIAAREVLKVRPSVLDPAANAPDFLLAARQQVLLRGWRARALWNRPAALVEAWRLADGEYVMRLEGEAPLRLFRLVFSGRQHLVEAAGGAFLLASARVPVRVGG
ncbi:MAG: hypothetical protein CSA74_01520 [Rhodobacterales bacterium]|nr:MAG: hypothetical protein CSA74_01520 [Rhodobacterales bacterium]